MWIYVPPSEDSASALVSVDSTSGCDWPSEMPIGLSLQLNGALLQPQSWLRASKTRPFLRFLSGIQLAPSTAARGVDEWISSLPVSPVNPTAWPDSDRDTRTNGPSGRSSSESSQKCAPPWFSSRTSQGSFSFSDQLERLYRDWVTSLRRDYSARQKAARRSDENGCSSSAGAACNTPHVEAHGQPNNEPAEQSQTWPTPAARDWRSGDASAETMQRNARPLNEIATSWTASHAQQWQTPSVADAVGGHLTRSGDRRQELLLRGQARHTTIELSTHPDPGTALDGGASLPSDPNLRPQLNASFVEWLQGLPPNWINPYQIIEERRFEHWETQSCRSVLPERSSCSTSGY